METESTQRKNGAQIKSVLIEQELKSSFLDYAMSVIISRAIPDVRDGLKPVHRRILYTMSQLGLHHNRPPRKSVRVVGNVMAEYHPHGDQAVYNTMAGMVQKFSKRYPLLDGQGNWGSIDGDNAAAMRYTEVRMHKIAEEILADLNKNTVPFVPNFDESTTEPTLLPSKLPNLLANGTAGIAVGMATSIPPHNLGEILDACLAVLNNPALTDEELFNIVPAPDFPTGGIICGRAGILKAYQTGRGKVIVRAVVDTEENKKGAALVITELPYLVNKADLIIKIADLVKNKIVEGIANIRDESNKKGIRLVIELKRGEIPDVVLNQLYKYTVLQTSISILMLALLDNQPIIFTLRQMLDEFITHRREIVYRRTVFDLEKAQQREHILTGLLIALRDIDEVVQLIKKSLSPAEAAEQLNRRFLLSEAQSKAILEMRLQRLTGLEQEKIKNELEELKKLIKRLKEIIENEEVLKGEIRKEFEELKNNFADERRSRIAAAVGVLTEAELISEEDMVITLTRKGYIKRVALTTYGVQHRGGKGKMGMASLEGHDDIVQDIYVTSTHDEMLFFTNYGRVYSMTAYEIPEASRIARGRAIVNIVPLTAGEKVVKLLCTRGMEGKNVVMLSKKGIIKRTDAMAFAKIRQTGIKAVGLREDDELVFCAESTGNDTVIIATVKGQGIRFDENEVRVMGRQAAGVMGIRLRGDDHVVGMVVISDPEANILVATERGYGKRTRVADFRVAHRGGYGVRLIPTGKRNGDVIGLVTVTDESNILLIDTAGKIIRLSPAEVRTMGRQAKGVRLIKLDKAQTLSAVVAFEENGGDQENGGEQEPTSSGGPATQKTDDNQGGEQIEIELLGDDSEPQFISFEEADEADDGDTITLITDSANDDDPTTIIF